MGYAAGGAVGWGTATSWKVAVSIPDGVIGIFYWHNPTGRTLALGLTQPLTEMSTRNISWWWRRPVRRADNLTTFMCPLSWDLGASTFWKPQGLSRSVMGLLYLYHFQTTLYFDLIPLLLLLALQPTVGFSLLGDFLPFCSFLTLLSPPSYSHYLQIFFNACNPSLPWSPFSFAPIVFHCNILLGILLSSIRITWPSQAILLLFINLTISAFPISSFSS